MEGLTVLEPPSDLKDALVRRYRLYKGTDPFSETGLRIALNALRGKVIPASIGPLYLHAIESMERQPHIREIDGKRVVIHDEGFADTINFLELAYVGEDRPLVQWAVLARVLAEFLYVDDLPGLGLYFADRINAHASQFADADGFYARPILVRVPHLGNYDSDTRVEKIRQAGEARAERMRSHFDLQRCMILFHEIGHALYAMDRSWREEWRARGSSALNPLYASLPLVLDSEYGLSRADKMSSTEQESRSGKLVDKMVEEISCDWFALASVLLNISTFDLSIEDAIRIHWRFMLFTDLIDHVRLQARQRTRNKIRFRSQASKLFVRSESILSILEAPERAPQLKFVGSPYRFRKSIESVNVKGLASEFDKGLQVAGNLLQWAVNSAAPWERDLHYGGFNAGYFSNLTADGEQEPWEIQFDKLFGDDFLREYEEPDATRIAPGYRSAGHLLSRSRAWANDYFADDNAQRQYASMAQEGPISSVSYRLRATFQEVTRDKAKRNIFVRG